MQQPRQPKRPPRYQVVFALTMVAIMLICATIGCNFEYIHGVYVRGSMAFCTVFALLGALYFPSKSIDDHRRDNPDDPDGGVG